MRRSACHRPYMLLHPRVQVAVSHGAYRKALHNHKGQIPGIWHAKNLCGVGFLSLECIVDVTMILIMTNVLVCYKFLLTMRW